MDGLAVKLAGGVYIGIDMAKDCDTCVEWSYDQHGNIVVHDCYKSNEAPADKSS